MIETTSTFLVVTISLFWAATNYAAALGDTRVRQYEREFTTDPAAVLYSKERLHLDAPGVEEVSCQESGGGYRFRYHGLRLMIRSGGRYSSCRRGGHARKAWPSSFPRRTPSACSSCAATAGGANSTPAVEPEATGGDLLACVRMI